MKGYFNVDINSLDMFSFQRSLIWSS